MPPSTTNNSQNNSPNSSPVESLKAAMLERARTLAAEHIAQGNHSRQKILQDAREKIHLMEQKELLLAKSLSDREQMRKIQASEIQMQAELDRNRWEMVQTVLNRIEQHLQQLQQSRSQYHDTFVALFQEATITIDDNALVAYLNQADQQHYGAQWESLCSELTTKTITLSEQTIDCYGGIRITSNSGDVMIDNTFEGLLARQQQPLQQVIFERLFATVDGTGALLHG